MPDLPTSHIDKYPANDQENLKLLFSDLVDLTRNYPGSLSFGWIYHNNKKTAHFRYTKYCLYAIPSFSTE